jgi:hypothetical protein
VELRGSQFATRFAVGARWRGAGALGELLGLYREALSRINKAGVSSVDDHQDPQRLHAGRSRLSLPAESTTESDPWSEIAR